MYKVEAFILRCLNSCINQDIKQADYEIICINDGSPDKSRELAEGFGQNHSNVKVISQENGGLSAARNAGIDHAAGDYIMFVDSDDWIEPNCLLKITKLCTEKNLDLLQICAADVFEGNRIVKRFNKKEGIIKTGRDCLLTGLPICAPFTIYRREFLNKHDLRFLKGIFHEDNEFTPRAYYYALRVSALNDIVYYVYQNPNSITRSINPKKSFDAIVVMESLHDFSTKISDDTIGAFHFKISEALNVGLWDSIGLCKKDVKKLNIVLYEKRFLLFHLKRSGVGRFVIEWFLFKLFPKHIVETYRFLIKLDYRKK